MHESMSIWSLILEASLFVQLVMALLVGSSIYSWVVIFERRSLFAVSQKSFAEFEERFWSGLDLTQQYRQLPPPEEESAGEAIFRAGFREFQRLRQQTKADEETIMVAVQRAMRVCINKELTQLDAKLPFLATIGSTAPYIGLLGTVWGIMNAFLGLAEVRQATLATVAPGIAEALIATAMGLFAAIPAVVAYNRFSTQADRLAQDYETFAEEVAAILHRQLHVLKAREQVKSAPAAKPAATRPAVNPAASAPTPTRPVPRSE